MSALTKAVRQATRRAEDDEDEDVKVKSRAETEEETESEEEKSEPAASEDDEKEASEEEDNQDTAEDEEEEKPQARSSASRRSARGYTLAHAEQTIELCAIAGVSVRQAHRFVKAHTPLAEVRSTLAARAKGSSDSLTTTPAKADAASSWDDVIAKVNAQAGVSKR